MLPTRPLIVVASMLLSLVVARPMPTPQMLSTKVGETSIWTQLEGTQILPRMAQMLNTKVTPGGTVWTEIQGGEPVPVTTTPESTVSQIRRAIDARWW